MVHHYRHMNKGWPDDSGFQQCSQEGLCARVEKSKADSCLGRQVLDQDIQTKIGIKPALHIWGTGQDRTGTHTEFPHLEEGHFCDLTRNAIDGSTKNILSGRRKIRKPYTYVGRYLFFFKSWSNHTASLIEIIYTSDQQLWKGGRSPRVVDSLQASKPPST